MQRLYQYLGRFLALLNLLMIVITVEQVLARYLFQESSIALQELEWHLFGTVFLLSGALTLRAGEHVRVDIFYNRLPDSYRAWIDILGVLVFLLPMAGVLMYFGWLDVQMARSYQTDLNGFRPLLWLAPESSWQDSWLFEFESILVDLVLRGEASANPGGLPARWLIKAMLPLAALLLALEGLLLMGRSVTLLRSKER